MNELTTTEQSELSRCEETIQRGMAAFHEVGQALLEIREKKLHRLTHKTFALYCEERWGLKQSRAYQLIDAAEVVASLKTSTTVELLTNEAQARELAKIKDPEQRREVWEAATASGQKPTAARIAKVLDPTPELTASPSAGTVDTPLGHLEAFLTAHPDLHTILTEAMGFGKAATLEETLCRVLPHWKKIYLDQIRNPDWAAYWTKINS